MFTKLIALLRRRKKDKTTTTPDPPPTTMATPAPVPETTKAVVIKELGIAAIESVPTPTLRDDYILVKTTAVALNPTDWKHVERGMGGNPVGTRVGCDYAGVVVRVGKKVTKDFKPGDRIAGPAHGSNQSQHEDGAFAEYIMVKGDVAIKPDGLTDEEAATLGIGITTVGQGLYQTLKLPLPTSPAKDSPPILIYGATTATGILGVQFAAASGYAVHATTSAGNLDYVRGLGAAAVYDYRAPSWAADVRAATGGRLALVWDCVASEETARACAGAMGEEGGVYGQLLRVPAEVAAEVNPKVTTVGSLAYTVFGEEFVKAVPFPAKPEDFEFGKMWWELARGMLASGKVKVSRKVVNEGGKGLEGVLVGLKAMKAGTAPPGKLVYTM